MCKLIHTLLLLVIVTMPYCFCSEAHGVSARKVSSEHSCCESEQAPLEKDTCPHCAGSQLQNPFVIPFTDIILADTHPFSLIPFPKSSCLSYGCTENFKPPVSKERAPPGPLFKLNAVYRL